MTEKRKEPSMPSEKMWALMHWQDGIVEVYYNRVQARAEARDRNGRYEYRGRIFKVVRVTVTWDDRRATRRKP